MVANRKGVAEVHQAETGSEGSGEQIRDLMNKNRIDLVPVAVAIACLTVGQAVRGRRE
ncbi:MAG: hypothetical protein NTZ09_04270 [Candidatus Hydrogenedentes bacterium]|nr:hypothetical protein [Candidatus Hydrogenedentota bacterium]